MSLPNRYPLHAEALRLRKEGKNHLAIQKWEDHLLAFPEHLEAHQNLTELSIQIQDWNLAEKVLQRALKSGFQQAWFYFNLGVVQAERLNFQGAKTCFSQALKLDPNDGPTLRSLAEIHFLLNEYWDAERLFNLDLEKHPESIGSRLALGRLKRHLNQWDECETLYRQVLQKNKGSKDARLNLSLLYLIKGSLRMGFKNYVLREKPFKTPPLPPFGAWLEEAKGKHYLVIHDQGLGDELFFLRFIPQLIQAGAQISYYTKPKLFPVLKNSSFFNEIATAYPTKSYDDIQHVGDLGWLCGCEDPFDIPAPFPLSVTQDQKDRLSENLNLSSSKPLVGLTWRAGKVGLYSTQRKIPLDQLVETLKAFPFQWVICQRHAQAEEIQFLESELQTKVINADAYNESLDQMLVLLSCLNAYVSVSNTNVHLAASLSLKPHVLIPFPPEWRWGLDDSSAWYPEFPLFRQSPQMDWKPALEQLNQSLKDLL